MESLIEVISEGNAHLGERLLQRWSQIPESTRQNTLFISLVDEIHTLISSSNPKLPRRNPSSISKTQMDAFLSQLSKERHLNFQNDALLFWNEQLRFTQHRLFNFRTDLKEQLPVVSLSLGEKKTLSLKLLDAISRGEPPNAEDIKGLSAVASNELLSHLISTSSKEKEKLDEPKQQLAQNTFDEATSKAKQRFIAEKRAEYFSKKRQNEALAAEVQVLESTLEGLRSKFEQKVKINEPRAAARILKVAEAMIALRRKEATLKALRRMKEERCPLEVGATVHRDREQEEVKMLALEVDALAKEVVRSKLQSADTIFEKLLPAIRSIKSQTNSFDQLLFTAKERLPTAKITKIHVDQPLFLSPLDQNCEPLQRLQRRLGGVPFKSFPKMLEALLEVKREKKVRCEDESDLELAARLRRLSACLSMQKPRLSEQRRYLTEQSNALLQSLDAISQQNETASQSLTTYEREFLPFLVELSSNDNN